MSLLLQYRRAAGAARLQITPPQSISICAWIWEGKELRRRGNAPVQAEPHPARQHQGHHHAASSPLSEPGRQLGRWLLICCSASWAASSGHAVTGLFTSFISDTVMMMDLCIMRCLRETFPMCKTSKLVSLIIIGQAQYQKLQYEGSQCILRCCMLRHRSSCLQRPQQPLCLSQRRRGKRSVHKGSAGSDCQQAEHTELGELSAVYISAMLAKSAEAIFKPEKEMSCLQLMS